MGVEEAGVEEFVAALSAFVRENVEAFHERWLVEVIRRWREEASPESLSRVERVLRAYRPDPPAREGQAYGG